MTPAEQLRQALAEHASRYGPPQSILGTVAEVQSDAGTCTVKDDDDSPPYYGVRLTPAITTGQNLRIVPKAGSLCLMVRIEGSETDWWLLWAEEIDKWQLHADGAYIEADEQGIKLSRSTDGLREVLTDLVTQILAIYAPKNVAAIQQIQLRINQLLKPA